MPEYQFVTDNGRIVTENYDGSNVLAPEQILHILQDAFNLFPYVVQITQLPDLEDVFHVFSTSGEGIDEIYICGKSITPGGRQGLANEQRIQPKAKYLNFVYEKQCEGKTGIFLGVYKREEQVVFCAWRVAQSGAAPETPISKQIKINCIAKAMQEGFSQSERGRGEFVCAFKPEFLYFYIRNCEWLHTGKVDELNDHISRSPDSDELCFDTDLECSKPRNLIVFGAPGTGKSYTINNERKELLGENNETNYERVTFHPDYSYANFVGTYKPVPYKDNEGNDLITYEYVPGPFMRVYVNALKSGRTENPRPFLLIIEEINRANVAAVFGDVFQLLDRDENGVSEYPINASKDMKQYMADELGGDPEMYSKIKIPNNMFIWATMNSADQGVFPMDTAFKRRWDFTYLGIDDSEKDLKGKYVLLGKDENRHRVEWNKLRKAINRFLAEKGINEDKQLGPYFISRRVVVPKDGDEIQSDEFISTFKNKVLMYLFEDAAKQKRPSLFDVPSMRYSDICKAFDEKGGYVFCSDIISWAEIEKIDDSDSPASQASEYTGENG